MVFKKISEKIEDVFVEWKKALQKNNYNHLKKNIYLFIIIILLFLNKGINIDKRTACFNDPIQALVYINITIFTANQNYLDGKIKLPLGECHLQTSNDRVIYQSHAYISGIVPNGWGLWRTNEPANSRFYL